MNPLIIFLTIVLISFGSQTSFLETTNRVETEVVYNDDLKIFDFDGLQDYLAKKDPNKTYVINFWATWCAPCVKELPYFETLNANYANNGVEVILVSLDFPRQIESRLKPFLKKRNLKSEVLVLDDVDANSWIPKIDKDWSGAIPATLIYNQKQRQFYERSFNYEELENEIKPFIK